MIRALVLAAGRSTRIRAVAGDLPKPLVEVAGKPAIAWNLEWLASEGVRDVWINLHYRGEAIRAYVGDGTRYGLNVRYSEEQELLGTAGAVRRLAADLAIGDFLVVYGDNVTRASLKELLHAHRERGAVATIAVFDRRAGRDSGIAGGRVTVADDGRVLAFVEGRDDPSPFVNAGVYALSPSMLNHIPSDETPCDFGRDVFPRMLSTGTKLYAHVIDGWCFGIDTPEALERANERLATFGRAPAGPRGAT